MVGTRRLSQLVESALSRLELPDGPYVVALSGGADSAALARFLVELHIDARGLHINHGLAHSSTLERAASSIAGRLGLDLQIARVTVPEGPSPEGQARRARYSAFADSTAPGERLLTAHTRDDNIETILLNLIRGTGPTGLGGIPWFRPHNIYRPILQVSRSETREIATLAGLAYVDDPMNDDPLLTRNIVRARVIPMLSELNNQVGEALLRMSAAVSADARFLDELAARVPLREGEDGIRVAIGDLVSAPSPVGDRVLKTMLARILGSEAVTAERVDRIWSVAKGDSDRAEVASGIEARRSGPSLVLTRPDETAQSPDLALTPGLHRHDRVEFDVTEVDGICGVLPLSKWAAVFPSGTDLEVGHDGVVTVDGEPAWVPGEKRLPVAWYQPGESGYLSVRARERSGWTSSP